MALQEGKKKAAGENRLNSVPGPSAQKHPEDDRMRQTFPTLGMIRLVPGWLVSYVDS